LDPSKTNEYIIVSAHSDHVGISSGLVNNDAGNNASGIAVLIGVTRQLQKSRPIVRYFLSHGMVKRKFLSSKYCISDPVFSLENNVLSINFENLTQFADTYILYAD